MWNVSRIEEDDEWSEDLDGADTDSKKAEMMSAWMENYMDAICKMEEKRGE